MGLCAEDGASPETDGRTHEVSLCLPFGCPLSRNDKSRIKNAHRRGHDKDVHHTAGR